MLRNELEKKLLLLREQTIRTARNNFWEYCKVRAPEFYKEHRHHLKTICHTLESLYKGTLLKPNGEPYENLMLNLPP